MSAYDINTIIRLHSSHLPMPLPFNEDYYYQSYLAARQRSPSLPLPRLLLLLLLFFPIYYLINSPFINYLF